MGSLKRVFLLLFITSLITTTIVIVLQSIAWGQEKVYPKYAVEVGTVKPNNRWKTQGTFAVVTGKDANIYVSYLEESDEFVLCLEATKEHAATDGYIPPMKIVPTLSNMVKIQARKE